MICNESISVYGSGNIFDTIHCILKLEGMIQSESMEVEIGRQSLTFIQMP